MSFLTGLFSNFWIALLAKLLFVALFIPLIGIVLTFSEIKLSAKMQHRVGPYFAGGRWGWAQPIADGIKFFQKEDLIPTNADRRVFVLAPALVLIGTLDVSKSARRPTPEARPAMAGAAVSVEHRGDRRPSRSSSSGRRTARGSTTGGSG